MLPVLTCSLYVDLSMGVWRWDHKWEQVRMVNLWSIFFFYKNKSIRLTHGPHFLSVYTIQLLCTHTASTGYLCTQYIQLPLCTLCTQYIQLPLCTQYIQLPLASTNTVYILQWVMEYKLLGHLRSHCRDCFLNDLSVVISHKWSLEKVFHTYNTKVHFIFYKGICQ